MNKYRTSIYSTVIEKGEVERASINSVWIKGRSCRKHTQYENYWNSWEDARKFLFDKAYNKLEIKTRELEQADTELAAILNIPQSEP